MQIQILKLCFSVEDERLREMKRLLAEAQAKKEILLHDIVSRSTIVKLQDYFTVCVSYLFLSRNLKEYDIVLFYETTLSASLKLHFYLLSSLSQRTYTV